MNSRGRGRPRGSAGSELLAVARELFVAQGFRGATMDAIAAAARVSKQTLYAEYPSKDFLFAAVVQDWVSLGHDAMRPHVEALAAADDVRAGLSRLAAVLQAGILSPPVLQMRTLVSAEAERFPDVAADYVKRSWDRNVRQLGHALKVLADRGFLRLSDPRLAAEQFTWLVVAAPLNRLSLGDPHTYSASDLRTIADEAVTTFLSRFAERGP